jgi:hypothetical protein
MALTTYRPGLRCVAIGDNGDPPANFVFLSRLENSVYNRGIGKVAREYEHYSRYAVQDVVSEGRVPRLTLDGDADSAELPKLITSVFGTDPATIAKAGGALASAVPLVSARIFEGGTDGTTGTTLLAYYEEMKLARVERLRLALPTPAGKWKYQAQLAGIFSQQSSLAASGITFDPTTAKMFNMGGTVVTAASATMRLLTCSLEFTNAADPLFTTVLANQSNSGDWTSPTSFDEGAVGCTYDFTYRASELSATAGSNGPGDYETNTARAWAIVATNASKVMTINLYAAQHLTAEITKQGSASPRVHVTGVCVFAPASATGHAITIA